MVEFVDRGYETTFNWQSGIKDISNFVIARKNIDCRSEGVDSVPLRTMGFVIKVEYS